MPWLLTLLLSGLSASAAGQQLHLERMTPVGDGLHLWYEIKSDPESQGRLIICGTKWDALANAPFGFVYFSADAGRSWRNVLEDRSSAWVTEHSCAFGPNHRAYFVSEAAKDVEGGTNPELGTTRLFLSTDSGEHWSKTLETGWADYSTSAVSKTSGRLYTFFQASWIARDAGRQRGSDLGLLVFSHDGRTVAGPYFSSGASDRGYHGIYPSDAVSLRSGAVIALYFANRQTPSGLEADLGTIRADQSNEPALARTVIAHPLADIADNCVNFFNGSLAYDAEHNQISVIYMDGCRDTNRIMLATSEDEGRTWDQSVPIATPKSPHRRMDSPSLVVGSNQTLGLLWKDKATSSRWLFSNIRDGILIEPALELTRDSERAEISNDSLWTWIDQPNAPQNGAPDSLSEPTITLNLSTMLNAVWRANGLLPMNGKMLAIWSSGTAEGMGLYSGLLSKQDSGSTQVHAAETPTENDVTRDMLLVYGGDRQFVGQHFDNATGTINVYAALANRGQRTIKPPIKLLVEGLKSPWGTISILNATNGMPGVGAIWDMTSALTGDRIPPGAATNPICMSFRLKPTLGNLVPAPADLVHITVKVSARYDSGADVVELRP
jgi:hypothetical protein